MERTDRTEKKNCPLCRGEGTLLFWTPMLRKDFFVFEERTEDCPLCDAYGHVQIIQDHEHQRTNRKKGNIHPG